MDRRDRAPVATFFATDLPADGGNVPLGDAAARHATVRRLSVGDLVGVTDGRGGRGVGTITRLRRNELVVTVERVDTVGAPPALELFAPVADRDRMLWLAEKCTELGISVWQPVLFARSRSVTPRGEGDAFAAKVRARMIAALEQSGGSWLPEVRHEIALADVATRVVASVRYLLDREGRRLLPAAGSGGVAVILGPEGGIEPAERALLEATGWRPVRLVPTTLRFETAGIAAVAILRAGLPTDNAED